MTEPVPPLMGDILIVDDVPENLEILAAILFEQSFEVSFATNGFEALESVARQRPDLILLDVSMPAMDGFEVCRRLQSRAETRIVPVIFLTARDHVDDVVRGLQIGAVDYLTKPFRPAELLARVRSHLALKRARDTIAAQNAELQALNEQLTAEKSRLERQVHDVQRLNALSERLQACEGLMQAHSVLGEELPDMFADGAGSLLLGDGSSPPHVVVSWGDVRQLGVLMANGNECHVLRGADVTTCPVGTIRRLATTGVYHCLPLDGRGRSLGVLHLYLPQVEAHREALARAVTQALALALVNLRLREQLHEQAIRDPLTGLFNRRYLDDMLPRLLRRLARKQASLALILLDLDHFKRVNDTYGHPVGDELLRALGQLLRDHVRSDDIACRYGGEEFLLALPEVGIEIACERAELLRQAVKRLVVAGEHYRLDSVTLSVGVAILPDHGSTVAEVLDAADQALYGAKKAGRDRVMVATAATAANTSASLDLSENSNS